MAGYKTTEARLRGFADATDAYLFPLFLQRGQVDTLLKGLSEQLPLVAAVRGVKGAETPLPFPLADATKYVREALAPLGPAYAEEMTALLDPRNGRIDVAGGPSRNGLGTGWGFPASQPSILYWPVYTGVYDDLDRGLSHEGGHAVHFQMMRRNHVLPTYSEGPGYFFESFAEFNQLLLADYMYRRETNPKRKLFYLQRFLDKASYPISLAFYPALEFAIYDGVAKGEITNGDGLDATETRILTTYGVPGTTFNVASPIWTRNETFYGHPLYNINHVLGAVLADAYYAEYQKNPKAFVPKYIALLSNGFDASPNDLLKKFLGFDLNDPSLAKTAGDLVRQRSADLERLKREANP